MRIVLDAMLNRKSEKLTFADIGTQEGVRREFNVGTESQTKSVVTLIQTMKLVCRAVILATIKDLFIGMIGHKPKCQCAHPSNALLMATQTARITASLQ